MQNKSVYFLVVCLVLCYLGITSGTGDYEFQGVVYQWGNWNVDGVNNGPPSKEVVFKVDEPVTVTYIDSYHWNYGKGVTYSGFITLKGSDGKEYGPFVMDSRNGQGSASSAIWYKSFDKGKVVLPAGKYTVVDSDPKTGSNNAKSGNAGFFGIKWEPYGSPKYYPPDPAVPKATKVDTPSKTLDLGNEWTSSGGGWTCYWRRSPGTNTFSAVFTKAAIMLKIHLR